MQATGLYTVGGLMMMLFLSACAAAGNKGAEGPTPSVEDNLAPERVPVSYSAAGTQDDDIPVAG
jgi:hypothetical protein